MYHDFVEKWLSHSTEIFVGEPFVFPEVSFIEKFYGSEGDITTFSRKFFVWQDQKNFWWDPFVSEKFWSGKIAQDGVSRFCRKMIFSQYRKFRRGTLRFSGSFFYRKILWIEVRYHGFLSEHFCLTVPEKFRRGTLCLSESFWYRKFLKDKRGYHYLPSKIFCLTVPENFVKEQFCVSENFWYREFLWKRVGREEVSRYSVNLFLSQSIETFRRRTLRFFGIFRLSKDFMQKRGDHDFVSEIFCFTAPKFSQGNPSVF